MTYKMSLDLACNLCGDCADICPVDALTINEQLIHDGELCTYCESCIDVCEECAIRIYDMERN